MSDKHCHSRFFLSLIGRGPIVVILVAWLYPKQRYGKLMREDPKVLFGRRLAQLRQQRGWSQETLSLESGVARSYLGGVERGQRNIALINICKLAEALDVLPGELFSFPRPNAMKRGSRAT